MAMSKRPKAERVAQAGTSVRKALASAQRVVGILDRVTVVLGVQDATARRALLEPLARALLRGRRQSEGDVRDAQEALDVLLDASADEPCSPA